MTNEVVNENWKIIQIKTFTKWMNSKLKKADYPEISDLITDVGTGVPLVHLLAALGKGLIKHNPNPKSRIAKMENVTVALEHIKSLNITLINIGSPDIVDGETKLILGLIWTIISKMAISDAISNEFISIRDELLEWVQKVTEAYDDVDVKNFTTSWKDGLAFNAVIHRFRPELINYEQLDPRDAINNIEQAFTVAEQKLEIPRLLDAEDIVDAILPDEKSIMTYISQYYQKFKSEERNLTNKSVLNTF